MTLFLPRKNRGGKTFKKILVLGEGLCLYCIARKRRDIKRDKR